MILMVNGICLCSNFFCNFFLNLGDSICEITKRYRLKNGCSRHSSMNWNIQYCFSMLINNPTSVELCTVLLYGESWIKFILRKKQGIHFVFPKSRIMFGCLQQFYGRQFSRFIKWTNYFRNANSSIYDENDQFVSYLYFTLIAINLLWNPTLLKWSPSKCNIYKRKYSFERRI